MAAWLKYRESCCGTVPEAPEDLLWRLQRIADFFPAFGKDYETVRELHHRRDELRLDAPTRLLIEEYYRAWQAKKTAMRR